MPSERATFAKHLSQQTRPTMTFFSHARAFARGERTIFFIAVCEWTPLTVLNAKSASLEWDGRSMLFPLRDAPDRSPRTSYVRIERPHRPRPTLASRRPALKRVEPSSLGAFAQRGRKHGGRVSPTTGGRLRHPGPSATSFTTLNRPTMRCNSRPLCRKTFSRPTRLVRHSKAQSRP